MLIHVRDSAARERARAAFERDAERVGAGDRTSRAIETDIYVTNVCNIRCDYCYFYFEDYFVAPSHMQPKHPNLDHLKGIIDSVSGKTYTLVLLGGEPFSRPDIASLLAYIKEKDIFSTRVSTNGLLLTRNKSSLQFVDTLTISIDAMRIRQYPHHMNRLRKDLGQLRHEFGDSLPLVVPSWTTSPDDNFERDVVPFLDFARENNFIVKFLPLKVNQWANWAKEQEITLKAITYAGEERVTNQIGHTMALCDEYGASVCLVNGNQFYVDFEGNFLYPCDEYASQKVGTVFGQDLGELFEEGVRRFGKYPLAHSSSVCAHCPSGCHSDNSYILRNPARQLDWLR